jgi:predicted permease
MDTLTRDLRYAVRTLLRMRGVAVVAILTLALGIGATTTMFSVVHAMLLRPPPFADPDRLVILFNTSVTPRDGLQRLRWSMPNITELERVATSFESVGSFTGPLFTMSGHGDPEHIDGETVSRGYFQALRVSPIAGRLFSAEESSAAGAQPVAIISARLWKRKLASDPVIVGGTMTVNDVPLTIIGILPEGFAGLSGKAEIWIPPPMAARLYYSEYLTTPQNFISAVARLKDGVSLQQASAEMAAIGPRFIGNGSAPDTVWGAAAVPLREARVDPTLRQSALVLLAAAACVLLIACVNVAGLLLARARVRRREIAVRLAIGSGRRVLVQQLLTEGLVMAAIAGVCGTLLAWWGVDVFARTAPTVIASGRNNYAAIGTLGAPALDPGVLMFALASALGTTLLFALVPALAAARSELATALKEDDRGGGRAGRALSILVVSEVAIACLLLTAAVRAPSIRSSRCGANDRRS